MSGLIITTEDNQEQVDAIDGSKEIPVASSWEENKEASILLGRVTDLHLEENEGENAFTILAANRLYRAIARYMTVADGEINITRSYQPRKLIIMITLLIASGIACLGSLSFLIGRHFPKDMADFLGMNSSDEVTTETGEFLAWVNVVVEAIFYIWTISSLLPPSEPDPIEEAGVTPIIETTKTYLPQMIKVLPNFAEWGLALTSAVPLTLLSLIDQETMGRSGGIKYSVVASIGIITVISNKFFLTRTHDQFKQIWKALKTSSPVALEDRNLLAQVKHAFITLLQHSYTHATYISLDVHDRLLIELKTLFSKSSPHAVQTFLIKLFNDASATEIQPSKNRKSKLLLVPLMAVFAALAWVGLIATVPGGMAQKLDAPLAVQYGLMILAGIPLIEIGLSMGGEFGLALFKLCDQSTSLIQKQASWSTRLLGYIPMSLFGMLSFATSAAVTIQVFKSSPIVTWCLLPFAIFGMGIINTSSGIHLWDECLLWIAPKINADKKLFANYLQLLKRLQKRVDTMAIEEVVTFLLVSGAYSHPAIVRLTPALQDKTPETTYQMLREILVKSQAPSSVTFVELESLPLTRLPSQAGQLLSWMGSTPPQRVSQFKRNSLSGLSSYGITAHKNEDIRLGSLPGSLLPRTYQTD